jgi:hypothetical protein
MLRHLGGVVLRSSPILLCTDALGPIETGGGVLTVIAGSLTCTISAFFYVSSRAMIVCR